MIAKKLVNDQQIYQNENEKQQVNQSINQANKSLNIRISQNQHH